MSSPTFPASFARRTSGFTLIELMVVVAVIGVLAAITYAVYQDHLLKTRRLAAATCLLEYGQYLERYRARFFEDPPGVFTAPGDAAPLPTRDDRLAPPACLADLETRYFFTGFRGELTWPLQVRIAIVARPIGAQEKDKCSRLEWNSLGSADSVDCYDASSKVVETYQ